MSGGDTGSSSVSVSSGDESSSVSVSSGDESSDSAHSSVEKIVHMLQKPEIMDLLEQDISGVLDHAHSLHFTDGMYCESEAVKKEPKLVAKDFLNAACTQIKEDFKSQCFIMCDIFRGIFPLEFLAVMIQEEVEVNQKQKLEEKLKKKAALYEPSRVEVSTVGAGHQVKHQEQGC